MNVSGGTDAGKGGSVEDVIGGACHTYTSAGVEEGGWLADADSVGAQEGEVGRADAGQGGRIPDQVVGAGCAQVGGRVEVESSGADAGAIAVGVGDGVAGAALSGRSSWVGAGRAYAGQAERIIDHAGWAA